MTHSMLLLRPINHRLSGTASPADVPSSSKASKAQRTPSKHSRSAAPVSSSPTTPDDRSTARSEAWRCFLISLKPSGTVSTLVAIRVQLSNFVCRDDHPIRLGHPHWPRRVQGHRPRCACRDGRQAVRLGHVPQRGARLPACYEEFACGKSQPSEFWAAAETAFRRIWTSR